MIESTDFVAETLGNEGYIAYLRGYLINKIHYMSKRNPLPDAKLIAWHANLLVEALKKIAPLAPSGGGSGNVFMEKAASAVFSGGGNIPKENTIAKEDRPSNPLQWWECL